jgi:hypothetical protein
MTANDLKDHLRKLGHLYIDEFTWGGLRIDAIVIDIGARTVRGFEVKVSRGDYFADKKWQLYSEFCSSLSIVCPEGLIQPEEVSDPFGLLWIDPPGNFHWKKRPKNIQSRNSLAWTWTYLSVIEKELARVIPELEALKRYPSGHVTRG